MAGGVKAVGKDEAREFPNGKLEIANVGGTMIGRATFEPGWRWSESVKPIAGTDSCQVHHTGYVVSGRIGVRLDDGTEMEAGPGDAYDFPPGHDGWVIGGEPYVGVDFSSEMKDYAKK
jgi:hypothetical protein